MNKPTYAKRSSRVPLFGRVWSPWWLLVPWLVLPAGCGPDEPSAFSGKAFVSKRVLENGSPREVLRGYRLRLRFDPGSAVAFAGCNYFEGSYRIEDGRLRFGDTTVSAKGCSAELSAQDSWYFAFLGASPKVALTDELLTLEGASKRVEYGHQEDETCFSPEQNLDHAYDEGAVGCECAADAASECLDDGTGRLVALICRDGLWEAVEDGPCWGS